MIARSLRGSRPPCCHSVSSPSNRLLWLLCQPSGPAPFRFGRNNPTGDRRARECRKRRCQPAIPWSSCMRQDSDGTSEVVCATLSVFGGNMPPRRLGPGTQESYRTMNGRIPWKVRLRLDAALSPSTKGQAGLAAIENVILPEDSAFFRLQRNDTVLARACDEALGGPLTEGSPTYGSGFPIHP